VLTFIDGDVANDPQCSPGAGKLIVQPLTQSAPCGTYAGCRAGVDRSRKRHRRSHTRDQLEP
jgi:hypothetical protein